LSTIPEEIYRQRKEMWQERAAYLLGEMGAGAQSAETNLTNAAASSNWSLRGAATVALMKIRQQPPDSLIEQLKDTSNWHAWYENAMMVGQFGARAEPAVPILLNALQDPSPIIQAHALIALGMIDRQPEKCVPAIMGFLASPDRGLRQKAIRALVAFGTNAMPARQAIQSALNDSDPYVRREAKSAMKMLARATTSASRADIAEPRGAADGKQPFSSGTNQHQTSGEAGSRR
jgi:hypothetical protein